MKQSKHNPVDVYKQVILLYAGLNGSLDKLGSEAIAKYESELFSFLESSSLVKPYKYVTADFMDRKIFDLLLKHFGDKIFNQGE